MSNLTLSGYGATASYSSNKYAGQKTYDPAKDPDSSKTKKELQELARSSIRYTEDRKVAKILK